MKNLPKVLFVLLPMVGSVDAQTPLRVVNAASGLTDDFAPGTLISIQGSNLSGDIVGAPDQLTSFTVMDGVSVKIGTIPAGLFYVSPNEIRALIDPATPTGPTSVAVSGPTFNGSVSVNIRPTVAPGLFASSNAGTRDGLIINNVMFGFAPFTVTTGGQPTHISLFATGLDVTTAPTVTVGGVAATVNSYGPAACCLGMQQVDVTLPASLAGAGRVEIVATSNGLASNVVETVILPNVGQGPYPPTAENAPRSRELGAITPIPLVSQALVVDEKDDVVRVVDVRQHTVARTIALAAGSQPFSVGVNDVGSLAVVAERARAKVAFINLNQGVVLNEISVDPGPSSVVLSGGNAFVASADTGVVSILSITQRQLLGTVAVGHGARSIVFDDNSSLAYVANQDEGTISVIDVARRAVTDTIQLGANARPRSVWLLPGGGTLAVSEPNAGVLDLVDLPTHTVTKVQVPSSDIAISGTTVYLANQVGAMASIVPIDVLPRGTNNIFSSSLALDPGLRSLAVDTTDRLVLATSEANGTISLIDTNSNRVTGTINVTPDDRATAPNLPAITSLAPHQAMAGTTTQLTVNGAPLGGTFAIFFANTEGAPDPAFTISGVSVDPTGQQIGLTVQIAAGASKGDHVLRVFTPNGESTITAQTGNILTIL